MIAMNGVAYTEYLDEYRSEGIGLKLYSLILDIVSSRVRNYPPEIYSPNNVWDEDAITAICHDFTLVILIGRGHLEYDLLANETILGLRKALVSDLQRFLISTRRRSEYLNIYARVRRILTTETRFRSIGATAHGKGSWGLAGWAGEAYCQDLNEVISAMFEVDLPPAVKYRADSRKLSHVIGNADLSRLLDETLVALNRWTSLDLLMEGIRYRLGLFEATQLSLDEPIGAEGDDPLTLADTVPDAAGPSPISASTDMAEHIFEMLSDRQREILRMRLSPEEMSLEQIAERIGVGKSTVHNDQRTILRYIAGAGFDETEAETILSQLAVLCAGGPK
jgi:DNA-binding CsgD family transcriptional regulator